MIRPLVVKLGMLVLTMGLVFWMGWQTPDPFQQSATSTNDTGTVPIRMAVDEGPVSNGTDRIETEAMAAQSGAIHEAGIGGRPASHGLLDLNRADAKALESLPGIGAVLAQRVIAHRTVMGRFQAIEDLRAVKGIGAKTFERIRPLVTVATAGIQDKVEKQSL